MKRALTGPFHWSLISFDRDQSPEINDSQINFTELYSDTYVKSVQS